MEENNKQEQKSNLSFFKPAELTEKEKRSDNRKQALFVGIFGFFGGLLSALIANMLASVISIMIWAFTENPGVYFLLLFGQFIVYSIILYIVCYKIYTLIDPDVENKQTYLISYGIFYAIMLVVWMVGLFS